MEDGINYFNNGIEVRKITLDDFGSSPKNYQNETDKYSQLIRAYASALYFTMDDDCPHFMLRNMQPNRYRPNGGIVRCGEGPLMHHTDAHHSDIAGGDTEVKAYQKITDQGEPHYQISSTDPFSEYKFYADYSTWKEGDVLDLRADYFPFAIFTHSDSPYSIPYYCQFVLLSGTYEGSPIKALGTSERVFIPTLDNEEPLNRALTYACALYTGVRKDGRKECVFANVSVKNGSGIGLYWLEDEEFIVSSDVTLTADWQPLAFAPDDPSRTYTKATWEFGGKKFHYHVKWSGKGHTVEPRMSVPGLSQCYGTWYAGDTPYEHELYNGYGENGLTTEDAIRKMGLIK